VGYAKVIITLSNQQDLVQYVILLKNIKAELEKVRDCYQIMPTQQGPTPDALSRAKQVLLAGFTDVNAILSQLAIWVTQNRPQQQIIRVVGTVKVVKELCQ